MKTRKTIMIANSIFWAAAMIGSAIVLADTGYYDKIFLILFTLGIAAFLMLQDGEESIKSEWMCIRRLFSSNTSDKA